ncbi:hypothetical protein [Pseudoxanthomonas winnipegensis]|uniref:Uncharacterized protein n=1 Tax=Pseudoxanthomonas winnipegensis TaxID=2480810 RepID=A0A4V2HG23_9GAMM|nr:hypothetical protein [Pseudoxanthomonas winnipegensis]TAA43456.1 hypothetical protein EA655_09310 [Pseudoxanthomonas winnipegensis]
MIISFDGPTFYAQADEDQFFGWLNSLDEFQDLRGVGRTLNLSLKEPVGPESVRQLLVIFRRWRLAIDPLLPLRTTQTTSFALWDADLRIALRAET